LRYFSKLKNFNTFLLLFGFLLIAFSIYIYLVSPRLTYNAHPGSPDVIEYTIIRIIIGLIYTVAVVLVIRKKLFSRKNLIFIFLMGLTSRIILIPSEPILEDDYYRYLWDGMVTAKGYNPYEYPPKIFQQDTLLNGPLELYEAAESSGIVIERINHPHIRTIYPPTAQFFFALASIANPWSSSTWKILLLIIDIVVFVLLTYLLRKIKYTALLVVIYWWNPILLHEMFNAGHMDLIMYPFILVGIIFLLKSKIISSLLMFALAVGVKIWPIILFPFSLKRVLQNKYKLIIASSLAIIFIIAILYPIILTKLDNSLGFITYTKNWTNNESVFQLINLLVKQIIELFGINYHCNHCVTRWVVFILYSLFLFFMFRSFKGGEYQLLTIFYYLVAVLYFISPTQFPWYYTWILPFLVLKPRLSFVAYAILLPLYQLTYSYPDLVWLEHMPIVLLFFAEIKFGKLKDYLCANIKLEDVNS
jgi:alpha-1,6-mannosyltransferase